MNNLEKENENDRKRERHLIRIHERRIERYRRKFRIGTDVDRELIGWVDKNRQRERLRKRECQIDKMRKKE